MSRFPICSAIFLCRLFKLIFYIKLMNSCVCTAYKLWLSHSLIIRLSHNQSVVADITLLSVLIFSVT